MHLYVLRMLVSLIHPNYLFYQKKWFNENTYNGSDDVPTFKRNFNEYLYIFQFTWLFFQFFRTVFLNTLWSNDSSDRVVRMIGFRLSTLYILKCLMRDSRKLTVFTILISTIFYFTITLHVVESPLFYLPYIDDGYKSFVYASISLWNTMITIFTIGYGDIFVVTYLGRIFVSILTILSGIILSFVTVAMTIDFDFDESDRKAFTLVNSVALKEEVENKAAQLIVAFFKLLIAKKKLHWAKVLIVQIDFDNKKKKFSEKFNEYKNNRSFDPNYPIFRAMVDLELKMEETETEFVIPKKKLVQ